MDAEIHVTKGENGVKIEMKGTGIDLLAVTTAINCFVKEKAHLDMLEYVILLTKLMAVSKDLVKETYDFDVDEDALKEILKGDKDG